MDREAAGSARPNTRLKGGRWNDRLGPDSLVRANLDLCQSPKPLFGLQAKPGLGAMSLRPFLTTVYP